MRSRRGKTSLDGLQAAVDVIVAGHALADIVEQQREEKQFRLFELA